jgi:hypothetical protein
MIFLHDRQCVTFRRLGANSLPSGTENHADR